MSIVSPNLCSKHTGQEAGGAYSGRPSAQQGDVSCSPVAKLATQSRNVRISVCRHLQRTGLFVLAAETVPNNSLLMYSVARLKSEIT